MSLTSFFELLGGLGMFIFGMRQMADGLQKTAGNRLRKLLELLTTNPVAGVAVGTVVTAIIQSSSATTVMVVGFVNAGLMTLQQAIGVVMGANIGTTVTAQLIAFKLSNFALHGIALGSGLYFFGRSKRLKYIGQILLGFGLLFLGMTIMKDSMSPLRDNPQFIAAIARFGTNPILGVLVGTLMTVMVQSSSATIGILMSLAAVGVVNYGVAVPVLLGDNIGTTVTALLSSIGTNRSARRAAMAHVVFNLLGVTIFILIFYLVPDLPGKLYSFFLWTSQKLNYHLEIQRLIANTHTLFNVINTLVWLPFVSFLSVLVRRIIPGEDKELVRKPLYLDRRMLTTPMVAMNQARKELLRMGDVAGEALKICARLYDNPTNKDIEEVFAREDLLDELERGMLDYLGELANKGSLSADESERLTRFFHIINDIERVGDHCENLAELAEDKVEFKLTFSSKAKKDLAHMFDTAIEAFTLAMEGLDKMDRNVSESVLHFEDDIDLMEKEMRTNHILRLNKGECYPASGVVYLDVLSNLERIGDHASSIARITIDAIDAR
ncbi:MAG: Na/Pi cotransporter family protein [Halanaerobium sp.]|nr:Na/Pi cotransporter family protein [Halanaerobium sp.]